MKQKIKKAREAVEKRNQLDGLIMEVEKTLAEHKDKLPAEEITKVEAALEKAKTALQEKAQDKDALEAAYQELLTSSHKLAEIMYKGGAGEPGAGEPGDSGESARNGSGDNSDEPIEPEITK